MRKLVPILALGALTACTPSEVDTWLGWWHDDPQAAEDYAHQDWVQRSLQWGCESYCDVDDPDLNSTSNDVSSSSESSSSSDFDEPDHSGESDRADGSGDAGWGGSCSQWSSLASAAGWTYEQWQTLNWIMARESGCDPSAHNPSGATGLLQIMPMWADDCGGGSLYDPYFNLACGLHVYNVQGWTAWSVY